MDARRESQANWLFQQGRYEDALRAYTTWINEVSKSERKDLRISLFLNRSACYLKMKQFDKVVEDCNLVIELDKKNNKALGRKVKALCSLGRFFEAQSLSQEWLKKDPKNSQARREVKRIDIIVKALQDQDKEEVMIEAAVGQNKSPWRRVSPEGREDQVKMNSPNNSAGKKTSNIVVADAQNKKDHPTTVPGIPDSQANKTSVESESPSNVEMVGGSKETKKWKHRCPPRGLTSQDYSLCHKYVNEGKCALGNTCSHAHSEMELAEWRERFDLRRKKLDEMKSSGQQNNSYIEALYKKWINAENPELIMTSSVDDVTCHVTPGLVVNSSSKKSSHTWTFTITSKLCLQRAALLDNAHRQHFHVAQVAVGSKRSQKVDKLEDQNQLWVNPDYIPGRSSQQHVFRIKVEFSAEIYGTFRQSLVLDFGSEPILVQALSVESSCSSVDLDKLSEHLMLSDSGRWDISCKDVIHFEPKPNTMDETEEELLNLYPAPMATSFTMSETLLEPKLTAANYKKRIHSLLYIEEMSQFSSIARYNVKAWVQVVDRFMLTPSTVSMAKFAQNGELFARMKLMSELSEDTAHGRLILNNVNIVYLAASNPKNDDEPTTIYEALVEEKGKNFIFLRLSMKCVTDLGLVADKNFYAQVQFQLNRLPLCQQHMAVDRLPDLSFVFPDAPSVPAIPWTPGRQWLEQLDSELNAKQKEAVVAITADPDSQLPPLLIVGPYGTGKTFTLAQATKQILTSENTRVLICTHSNSAADLYIKEYLHPYVEDGHSEAKPLRVLYRHRWVRTVHPVVQEYCLMNTDITATSYFQMPTREDIEKRRVIVATFSTSRYLYNLGLEQGFFTHILLDEAAQAMECETILPLALAGPKTRIVLAGDHMQLSPEVHSEFARERGLHVSLLERLYDLYPRKCPCQLLLCENYRSHKAIIDFTSELFYDNRLVSSGNQPANPLYYPLTFFTARGEDIQHQNSTAFYNNAEVFEIVERVAEIKKNWPESWGPQVDGYIGVVSPYSDQVLRIRSELRKKKIFNVAVERVLNVQGKQFRAILLSTVRTQHTCTSSSSMEDFLDYGFLSNMKLLNTAITRAQSLVAVVGDPVSLCSLGKCRKMWEHFIEICHKNQSLHGMTWKHLRSLLDGVELKKTYILNPLAPEFVPNRLRHAVYKPPEPVGLGKFGYSFEAGEQPPAQSPQAHSEPEQTVNSNSPRPVLSPNTRYGQQPVWPMAQYQGLQSLLGGVGLLPLSWLPTVVSPNPWNNGLMEQSPSPIPHDQLNYVKPTTATNGLTSTNLPGFVKSPYTKYMESWAPIGNRQANPYLLPPMPGYELPVLPASLTAMQQPFAAPVQLSPASSKKSPVIGHGVRSNIQTHLAASWRPDTSASNSPGYMVGRSSSSPSSHVHNHLAEQKLSSQDRTSHARQAYAADNHAATISGNNLLQFDNTQNENSNRAVGQKWELSMGGNAEAPQIQFLPTACNVNSTPKQPALPGQPGLVDRSVISGLILPESSQQMLTSNPSLQMELYNYIMQTEGSVAAAGFLQYLKYRSDLSTPQEPAQSGHQSATERHYEQVITRQQQQPRSLRSHAVAKQLRHENVHPSAGSEPAHEQEMMSNRLTSLLQQQNPALHTSVASPFHPRLAANRAQSTVADLHGRTDYTTQEARGLAQTRSVNTSEIENFPNSNLSDAGSISSRLLQHKHVKRPVVPAGVTGRTKATDFSRDGVFTEAGNPWETRMKSISNIWASSHLDGDPADSNQGGISRDIGWPDSTEISGQLASGRQGCFTPPQRGSNTEYSPPFNCVDTALFGDVTSELPFDENLGNSGSRQVPLYLRRGQTDSAVQPSSGYVGTTGRTALYGQYSTADYAVSTTRPSQTTEQPLVQPSTGSSQHDPLDLLKNLNISATY